MYLDDVIIFSDTYEEHLQHLKEVSARLRQAGLTCKLSKCFFAQTSVEYLGHTVSAKGVDTSPRLVEKILQTRTPINVSELRTFLGLINYYLDRMPGYADHARPLNKLLVKSALWQWTPACQTSFDLLKRIITSAPVLSHPDFSRPFVLYCDASTVAVGGILSQTDDDGVEHPIRFVSKALTPAQRRYSVGELECYAVLHMIRTCRKYIAATTFKVVTDHKPLLALLGRAKEHRNARLTRWALELQEYSFDIIHRAGKRHQNADAMSLPPVVMVLQEGVVDSPEENVFREIVQSQRRQADLFEFCEKGTLPSDTESSNR